MKDHRSALGAWNQEQASKSTARESILARLRRQPELVLPASMVGGALLALLLQKTSQAIGNSVSLRKSSKRVNQGPHQMPSAHMGATEEQMEPRTKQATSALESAATGTTGAVYELDPASLSPG